MGHRQRGHGPTGAARRTHPGRWQRPACYRSRDYGCIRRYSGELGKRSQVGVSRVRDQLGNVVVQFS
jgi:hypothetical protein